MAKFAFCIGINDYPGSGNDLAGCVNDVKDWAALLKARGFTVTTLLDSAATGKAMRAGMAETIAQAKAGDQVVIQYSGHGSFVPDKNGDEPDGYDECLCPYDIFSKGPLIDDELSKIFAARADGVRLVFISDSCHSGTVARFSPIESAALGKGKVPKITRARFLPPSTFLSESQVKTMGVRKVRSASAPGSFYALLLSGCQDSETSADAWFAGRPNGAFTFSALKALETLEETATYQDWYNAIRKRLPSSAYVQTPNINGSATMKAWKVFS
ncbi:MAG: caspase domain-containing protein [Planctomycetota bacterium]